MGDVHICHHRTGSADSKQGSVLKGRVHDTQLQLLAVTSGDGGIPCQALQKD